MAMKLNSFEQPRIVNAAFKETFPSLVVRNNIRPTRTNPRLRWKRKKNRSFAKTPGARSSGIGLRRRNWKIIQRQVEYLESLGRRFGPRRR